MNDTHLQEMETQGEISTDNADIGNNNEHIMDSLIENIDTQTDIHNDTQPPDHESNTDINNDRVDKLESRDEDDAEMLSGSDNNNSSDEESIESSDSDSDNDENDANELNKTNDDGQTLSAYEIRRLERIRRNRDYLAKLGLDDQKEQQQQNKSQQKVKKIEVRPAVPTREIISRRSKARPISYAEPTRLRNLFFENNEAIPTDTLPTSDPDTNTEHLADPLSIAIQEETNNILDSGLFSTAFDADNMDYLNTSSHPQSLDVGSDHHHQQSKPKRRFSERMDISVYKEFKRINAHKNQVIKDAEKLVRAAEKEVRIWGTKWERWNTKWEKEERQRQREEILRQKERKRQLVVERQVKELEAFRRRIEYEYSMFGSTIKRLLENVDTRMPELYAAITEYDDEVRITNNKSTKEQHLVESEYRMRATDHIDLYPKALKNAMAVLNSILLQRAPKGKPEPRRSSRNNVCEELADTKPKRVVKKRNRPESHDSLWQEVEPIIQKLSSQNNFEKDVRENERNTKENINAVVSPAFASKIDRSWFFKNSIEFDPSYYVPQIGDIVLYYITGHKAFLESYPDTLEGKEGYSSRIPLWERAKYDSFVSSGDDIGAESLETQWWTQEWQRGVEEGDLGSYPLICRVERTYTEFPDEPNKTVQKDSTDEVIVTKVYRTGRDQALFKLRLVVCLQPITSVLPPKWHGDRIEPSVLCPPPPFSVTVFPSKLDPFIVPFAWAYAIRHTLKCNQIVFSKECIDTECRIDSFAKLSDPRYGSFSLDDKLLLLLSIMARLRSASTVSLGVQRELGCLQNMLEMECRVIIDLFNNLLKNNESNEKDTNQTTPETAVQLVDLILASLPLWQSVGLLRTAYERKLNNASPWNLILLENTFQTPWQIGVHSFCIEHGLRSKLDAIVADVMRDEDAEIFVDPVDERDAPEYYSVVPFGICLSQISQRLKPEAKGSKSGGSYRSVDSLLADVDRLFENCILYNDPESEIVMMAKALVDRLRTKIIKRVQDYNNELQEARKIDADRRMLVFYQGDDRSTSLNKQPNHHELEEHNTILHPFKDSLNRTWLEQLTQEGPLSRSPSNKLVEGKMDESILSWIPQPGDTILYSTDLHRKFLEGHYTSLCPNQCMVFVPPEKSTSKSVIDSNGNNECEWVSGEIVRARASFPRDVNKMNNEDVHTFVSNSPLLTLGVKFENNDELVEIHWRPCIFSFDPKPQNGMCPSCGVSCLTSFLHLSVTNEAPGESNPISCIPESEIDAISRCFSLLKQRCIGQMPIAAADSRITKLNLKTERPISPIQIDDLSYYDTLAEKRLAGTLETKDAEDNYPGLHSLVKLGFLPRWINENGTSDNESLRLCETLLPCTKLCLDFIRLRLLRNFYRTKKALENDVMEAYLSTVFVTLASLARRKQDPISIKRVIKLVVSRQPPSETKDTNILDTQAELLSEESNLAQIIRQVRDLYAAALVSISNTRQIEFVFGLQGIEIPRVMQESESKLNPIREEAREKIGDLLNAVGKDPCLNRFGKHNVNGGADKGYVNLRIFCNGRTTSFKKDSVVAVQTHAFATVNHVDFRVKIVCNEKVLTRNLTKEEADAANLSESMYQSSAKVPVSAIPFYAWDCEGNERLTKLFFGRPNRVGPCARCSLANQSMLTCRVQLGHSNPDYDWLSSLGGTGGVEGILHSLRTGTLYTATPSTKVFHASSEMNLTDSAAISFPPNQDLNIGTNVNTASNILSTTEALSNSDALAPNQVSSVYDINEASYEAVASTSNQQQAESNVDDLNEDPTDSLEQAKHVLDLAEQVHENARKYYEAPARLSEDFVDGFPVDDDDGHYIYCIICGLIGDLLCCDGCPNVVHTECIGLNTIPEGDWFCEECTTKKKNKPKLGQDKSPNGHTSADAFDSSNFGSDSLPFGRMEFDDSRIEDLNSWLDELREKRGFQKFKIERIDDSTHDRVSIAEPEEQENSSPHEDAPHVTETPTKRKRGRPRKFPRPEDLDLSMSSKTITNKRDKKRQRAESSDSDDDTPLVGLSKKARLKRETTREDEVSEADQNFYKDDSDVFSVESLSSVQPSGWHPRRYMHPIRIFDSEYVGVDRSQLNEVIVPNDQVTESRLETSRARRKKSTVHSNDRSRRLRSSRTQRKL